MMNKEELFHKINKTIIIVIGYEKTSHEYAQCKSPLWHVDQNLDILISI